MLNNVIFWKLIDLLTLLSEWIPLYILLNSLSYKKTSNKARHISFLVMIFVSFTINILGLYPNIKMPLCMVMSIIFYRCNYNVNLCKNLIIPLGYFMILIGMELLSINIVTTINSINIKLVSNYNLYRLECLVLSKPFLLIGVLFLKYHELYEGIYRKDALYIGIPICTNILSLLVIFDYELRESNQYSVDIPVIILVSFLLLLSSISLLIIVYKILRNNKLLLEHKIISEKINLEYGYYKKIENNQEKIKKLYHDMRNHMICISNLNNLDEIEKYIENINIELREIDNSFNTGNRIIDIIMSEKNAICIEKDIKFESFLNFSKLDFIDMTDICIIFSNALDNAIQACEKINDLSILKYISVKITYVNDFCVINIENSKVNNIVKKNNIIVTDKKDNFMHGIGIKNIKNTVRKYDGEVSINFTDNKFTLTMMIPVKKCPVLHS
ncbi:ATP-binding protein [Romboutsia sp.]|uniref:ATP-binding protein n=1 Tax=Romboutsia sp. TaxID=1965302 RepID=UPI002CD46C77|nr:ATP-binding protein [Romboutsia sp.]HSQ87260.1 ATP-binding protein [Romboutsia sp.]